MTPNHSSDKQRGSLLIVALGSVMAVGLVSVSLTTLVGQETGNSNKKIFVTRDTIFADSAFLFVRDRLKDLGRFNDDGLLLDDGTREENPTRDQLREVLSEEGRTEDVRDSVGDVHEHIYAGYKLENQGRFNDEGELLDKDREEVLYTDPTPDQIINALSGDDLKDVNESIENLLDRRLPMPD